MAPAEPGYSAGGKQNSTRSELPESCWQGLFADYKGLVAPTTEAPDAYHFAAFAVVAGALFGRRVWVHYANRLYPNFYVVLTGKSGLPRKSTSWGRARDLADAFQDASVQVIHGTGSAEGFLDALQGNGRVLVMVADEFRTLLGKGKQEGSILVPCLTELFSCGDYRLKTRQRAVEAVAPFVSIVANTTITWLEHSLAESDVLGGFAGRFLYVMGEPKDPLPYPPKADKAKFDSLVKSLTECRSFADDVAKSGGELVPSEEARATFSEYYKDHYRRCQEEGTQSTLLRRLPDYCWKLALLYAAMDKTRAIEVDHITPAIKACQFFEDCAQSIFATFGESKTLRMERKIEEVLKDTPGRTMKARDLQRKLTIDARLLRSLCDAMEEQGVIDRFKDAKEPGKRPTLYVTLL